MTRAAYVEDEFHATETDAEGRTVPVNVRHDPQGQEFRAGTTLTRSQTD